jgi:hypothetical protein
MKKSLLAFILLPSFVFSQNRLDLSDLSDFETKSSNWSIVGDVAADIQKTNVLNAKPGKGVLLCTHQQGKYGMDYELFSKFEHGDADIEFDFLIAKGSNSGLYLQGRYEIQLMDSWGVKNPKFGDCGGIYQRWNDNMPEGQQGFEGTAPRVNAAKAPGLWQTMKISFQAPRLDANGNKISNAKIISVELNGQIIHENIELSGVTRGSISQKEVASAPLRIQGDHGSIAFRNFVINNFDKSPGKISDLNYRVYYGSYMHDYDLSTLKIDERGKTEDLTWEVTKKQNDYVFVIKGNYTAPQSGKYTFTTQIGGNSYLKIDGKEILDNKWTVAAQTREASVDLNAGVHTFEIFNNKRDAWIKPTLGFWSAGPGFRSTPHHVVGALIASKPSDPIYVNADNNTLLRSFMDFKKSTSDKNFRIVHAISVGSPTNLHYTYDLDKGAIVQIWRGGFLDATPMWNDRGDGSSKPLGKPVLLNHDLFLAKNQSPWPADTNGTQYKPLGYVLDENEAPTFKYRIYGSEVEDKIEVTEEKYLTRKINIKSEIAGLQARLAHGSTIEKISDNLYAIDDKSYFIQITEATNVKIENGNELRAEPKSGKINYSILY